MLPIPKNALFTISTGIYSEYYVLGIFRAIETIELNSIREKYFAAYPRQNEAYNLNAHLFIAWLIRNNIIEPVDCFELHLSDQEENLSNTSIEKIDDILLDSEEN